ncbi:ligase-associated DNA damage response endonuclease PdeM [Dyella sp.]|jgi:DNA ligase-associated metallophosphoesterase|uniref:ligase-associated DNA damage response endonuclease PdeM n=1 Tax=Dyella sp. TaxID=1869338 RepID=UPI002D76A4B3|nr:ligase-associated DNA damage response endonuclease PdeM [Dyella sp.]HET6431500.1 ligase-associated DNA damage response endonuclease PdeM [Dyella sp.]
MMEFGIEVAGETLQLHGERAVFWPRLRWLLLADVHFGKGAVLRRAGVALPTGQTLDDLQRIDRLIAHYQPQRLVVLGDLVHGRAHHDTPWVADVQRWRERHAALAMSLVVGNHDRHMDAGILGFERIDEVLCEGPLALGHEPTRYPGHYLLAGHVHPGVNVRDGWRKHRLPAFRFGRSVALLPAFGRLTGLYEEPPRPSERIVAVTPAGLLPLATRAR